MLVKSLLSDKLSIKNLLTDKLPVKCPLTTKLSVKGLLTEKLSIKALLTNKLPIKCLLTGKLSVKVFLTDKLPVKYLLTSKLSVKGLLTSKWSVEGFLTSKLSVKGFFTAVKTKQKNLVAIYISFTRSHLDFGDILYKQKFDNSFHGKLDFIQYNTALAITLAISREKNYQELGFESLQQRRWCRKRCLFFKTIKNNHPNISLN